MQHRVFAAEGIGAAFRAGGIGQPAIVHHEEVFVVAGRQAQFDAPFPLGVGLEMVGLPVVEAAREADGVSLRAMQA